MKRRIVPLVLRGAGTACLLVAVMALACQTAPSPGPAPEADPLTEADRRAKALDPDLIIFQAGGVNGATLEGGSLTLEYAFLAVKPQDDSAIWRLTYDLSTWAVPERIEGPIVGVAYNDLTQVTVSESEARALLEEEGYGDDFFTWSLSTPLHPDYPDPLYAFIYEDGTVTIDTGTGAVARSDLDQAPPLTAPPPTEDSVSLEYIVAATEHIKDTSTNAFIIWAGGYGAGGQQLDTVTETARWAFLAIDLGDSNVRAWRLTLSDDTWEVEELTWPPMGIEYTDLTVVSMDVIEAQRFATDAGYQPPYQMWEVFKPLHAGIPHHQYVFTTPARFIIVDAETGEVSIE